MVQTLEAIRGGGGSIKVGTTGTISALMTRELESVKSASKVPAAFTFDSASAGETTTRRTKSSSTVDEASSSSSSNLKSQKVPEAIKKTRQYTGSGRSSHIPMLTGDNNISADTTPMRQKPVKRGVGVVEIVDIKCGNPEKAWVTNRLKKLGFSKLSETTS